MFAVAGDVGIDDITVIISHLIAVWIFAADLIGSAAEIINELPLRVIGTCIINLNGCRYLFNTVFP